MAARAALPNMTVSTHSPKIGGKPFWEHSANRQGLGRDAAIDLLRRLRGENGPKE